MMRRPVARPQRLLAYCVVAAKTAAVNDSKRALCRSGRGGKPAAAVGMVLSGSGCWSAATRLRCSGFIVFLHKQVGRCPLCLHSLSLYSPNLHCLYLPSGFCVVGQPVPIAGRIAPAGGAVKTTPWGWRVRGNHSPVCGVSRVPLDVLLSAGARSGCAEEYP